MSNVVIKSKAASSASKRINVSSALSSSSSPLEISRACPVPRTAKCAPQLTNVTSASLHITPRMESACSMFTVLINYTDWLTPPRSLKSEAIRVYLLSKGVSSTSTEELMEQPVMTMSHLPLLRFFAGRSIYRMIMQNLSRLTEVEVGRFFSGT